MTGRTAQAKEGLPFNAVDVECANNRPESICQIGIARVRSGRIVEVYSALVNPQQSFGWFHRRLHGIDEKKVRGKPSFQRIAVHVRRRLEAGPTVSHSLSDRTAINAAMQRAGHRAIRARWIDSIPIVQATWPERYADGSFGLANIAEHLGIEFRHHDAAEDARATAEIVLAACAKTGRGIKDWQRMSGRAKRKDRGGTQTRKREPKDGA